MKRVVFIGTIGCGKTTLGQALHGDELRYKKTQAVEIIGRDILDTPGEFLERRDRRGALMMTTMDAEVVVFIESATEERSMFPPGYAGSYAKPVIGVVTKIDIANEEQIARAVKKLEFAGARTIFQVSSTTGEGLDALMEFLTAAASAEATEF